MIDIDFYLSKLCEDTFVIFLFHGVIKDGNTGIRNYSRKHLLAEEFEILIKKLKVKGNPISMEDIMRHHDNGRELPKYSYAINFDDGFENNYSVAAPILEKYLTPAAFYISTNLVDKNLMTWIDQIEYCFEGELRLRIIVYSLNNRFGNAIAYKTIIAGSLGPRIRNKISRIL